MSNNPSEPSQAPSSVPLWQRFLSLIGPFCAGVAFITGLGHLADHETGLAIAYLVLSAVMVVIAWRWTA